MSQDEIDEKEARRLGMSLEAYRAMPQSEKDIYSRISKAPPPVNPLRGSGASALPPQSAEQSNVMSDHSEPLGETLRKAYDEHVTNQTKRNGQGEPPSTPATVSEAKQNRSVLEVCILLALVFGLPPGDALYRDEPITLRMVVFFGLGIGFAALGGAWSHMRQMSPRYAAVIGRFAYNNSRLFLAGCLVVFVLVAGPDIYRRATQNVSPPRMCFGGPCPTYEGSPLAWAWENYNIAIFLPQNPTDTTAILSFGVLGKNVGTEEISLKGAYLVSEIDGTRRPLKFRVAPRDLADVSDAGPIPPGAEFVLLTEFDPHLSEEEFFRNWGGPSVVIEYDDTRVKHVYRRDILRNQLDQENPFARPHVRRRKQ